MLQKTNHTTRTSQRGVVAEEPVLQLALDFLNIKQAMRVAREAVAGGPEGGVDWLEAGTPLIKSEGLDCVRTLRAEFPHHTIVADMKTMDAGRTEMEAAAKAGADVVVVLGASSESTVAECVEAAENYGFRVSVDLLGVADPISVARRAEELGAHMINIHCPIDDQMRGADPFEKLRKVREAISLPISVAGGIHSETAAQAVEAGADIVIVGGAISKSADAAGAASTIKGVLRTLIPVRTDLYKRELDVGKILGKCSAANLSDAMHRAPSIRGIRPLSPGMRAVGRAVTVRTYPGDWAKPVEAIEVAQPGEILVIDAGGVPPAVWGELASESAVQRGLAGVVVWGSIRDTREIRDLGLPAFSNHITPDAGEPKGFGEIGVPIRMGGVTIHPGDWILADDDGVLCLPEQKAIEYANRAMDVLERENRIRKEIREARTLSEVMELLRWEKK